MSELCENCAPVSLFSLFTGPRIGDGSESHVSSDLGTLQQHWTNDNCPLCRLIKQIFENEGIWDNLCAICDPSDIQCSLLPLRADSIDEMSFVESKTSDMLASRLEIRFSGLPHTSEEVQQEVRSWRPGSGIQLLSPGSVDPSRPLQNGFRATTMDQSLRLLGTWLKGCHEHHQDTCHDNDISTTSRAVPDRIRAIELCGRNVVEIDPATVSYAALSYVWGADSAAYVNMAAELGAEKNTPIRRLPNSVPKIIEDAIQVCRVLSIPYLWVDLYCIDQIDLTRKVAEIDVMGHIYRSSYITLVAGRATRELIPTRAVTFGEKQRIEKIGDRSYINELARVFNQLWCSEWIKRSWTYQEGHLARRVAFFGESDVSFMCGGGHWRESLHSGVYGHDTKIPNVNLASGGFHVLGGHRWLSTVKWTFRDYERMVSNYTRRRLSFESDKLNAIIGCMNLIQEKKDMVFLNGLPSNDFHYALLWMGEDGPRRSGFPSWSWAGWITSKNVIYLVRPEDEVSARLERDDGNDGSLIYQHQQDQELELQGLLLLPGFGMSGGWNLCKQQLANIRIPPPFSAITIESEAARFFVDIVAETPECGDELCTFLQANSVERLEPGKTYKLPYNSTCGLCLRDKSGNVHRFSYAWLRHWPLFYARLPSSLLGSELRWLMRDGLDLIKIVDITLLKGDGRLKPFRHVVCLGVDRTERIAGRGRRMGIYSIPGEAWDKSGPEKMTVELW